MRYVNVVMVAVAAILAQPGFLAADDDVFFTGLADLPGGTVSSFAEGISPGGMVAVGQSGSALGSCEAFY